MGAKPDGAGSGTAYFWPCGTPLDGKIKEPANREESLLRPDPARPSHKGSSPPHPPYSSPAGLLKDYAIVFQDVVLFNDTIMGNIRLGRKDATDEEVMAAARAAQCDEFVQRLPEGYQTVVGENGSTLSGGERQRISIARALLKNAPIVLLDEATASLDVENETSLQTALSALLKDKTVLVIAHRMRTVMGADHVVVLADGHVAEEGTPEQLMERGGMFRHMVELQRESSNWQVGGNRGGS